jgi:hypothetical protein
MGYGLDLYTRKGTNISSPLQEQIDLGVINHFPIIPD